VAANDAADSRKPEPAACELGREERIENLRLDCGLHPAAGIAHFEVDIFSGAQLRCFWIAPEVLFIDNPSAGLNRDQARVAADCLRRIENQICENLLYLTAIRFDKWKIPIEFKTEHDLFRNRRLDESAHFRNEIG
jgi:hypothetical protein